MGHWNRVEIKPFKRECFFETYYTVIKIMGKHEKQGFLTDFTHKNVPLPFFMVSRYVLSNI